MGDTLFKFKQYIRRKSVLDSFGILGTASTSLLRYRAIAPCASPCAIHNKGKKGHVPAAIPYFPPLARAALVASPCGARRALSLLSVSMLLGGRGARCGGEPPALYILDRPSLPCPISSLSLSYSIAALSFTRRADPALLDRLSLSHRYLYIRPAPSTK